MKLNTRYSFVVLFASMLVMSVVEANPLTGVWQLESGEYVDHEGKLVNYEDLELSAIKVISQQYFSFTSVKADKFWASGTGTYTFENGQYIETLRFNSFGEKPGAQFQFKSEVKGDKWFNARWKEGVRVEYEVWQRVE